MMQGPLIWGVVLAALAVVGYFYWRARGRRVVLDIQRIPAARLDNTPERSEIIGEVKVRPRDGAGDAPAPVQPVARPAPEPDASVDQPAAVLESAAPAEPATALTQTDMFPVEAAKPARAARSRKRTAAAEPVPETKPAEASEAPLVSADPDQSVQVVPPGMTRVFSLHVLARGRGFAGQALLELLLQYGLRFGDMQIFHRHEKPNGKGGVLFSVARAHEPGIFVLEQMGRELIGGVSFFMSLPGCQSLVAFDLMVDTARRLAKELDGDLLDEFSQAIQPSQLDSWRDLVVNHERQRLASP